MFTNKVFDREGEDGKQVSVTVKAVDAGEPSLEGVCSFTVEILDTNDNPPLFDRQVGLKLIFCYFMLGSLQILVTSFLVISSFWLRDFLYFNFLICLSCLAQ